MTLTKRTDLRDSNGNLVYFNNDELPDVQATTFSKDLMGRYVCSTLEEAVADENQPLDFDVIVLGAGMYGGYCASKLHQLTKNETRYGKPRILVLDGGPFLLPEHGQNIPDIGANNPGGTLDTFSNEAQQPREVVWGIGWRSNQQYVGTAYCIGGKSLYWGGWCPRLTDADLEQWPPAVRQYLTERPFKDPLFNKDVKGAYSVLEYEIGVKPADDFVFDPMKDDPSGTSGVGLNVGLKAIFKQAATNINAATEVDFKLELPVFAPIAVQTQSYISGLFSLDKYSSLPGLISARRAESGKKDQDARLMIIPNSHVVRLNLPKLVKDGQQLDGSHVDGLTVHYNGRLVNLKLKPTTIVVIALSENESRRLALESFSIAETRKRAELMGANLLNHLRRDITVKISRAKFNDLFKTATGSSDQLVKRPQTAALHLQASSPRGRFHFQIVSAVNTGGNPDVIYRMVPDLEAAQMIAEQGADMDATVNIAIRGVGELRGERDGKIITQQDKNWANLAYSDQDDPIFRHRRLYTHYKDESKNGVWADMDQVFQKLISELDATQTGDTGQQGLGTTWHEAGTLWMGDDPFNSVTDINGRFHHVGNVACVSQAIYPTAGSANPVITGLSLARKVAESIAARFESTDPPGPAPVAAASARQLWPNEKAKWKRSFDQQPLQPNRDYFETSTFSVINCDSSQASSGQLPVIYFDELFKDFRLTLQWMSFILDGDVTANSGIILRSPKPGVFINQSFYDDAIEVQIDETGYDFFSSSRAFASPLHRTGAIYGLAPATHWGAKLSFKPMESREGRWNTYEIEVKGASIRVKLNGELISKTDSLPANLQKSGFIGLQYHSGVTHFGNVQLETL